MHAGGHAPTPVAGHARPHVSATEAFERWTFHPEVVAGQLASAPFTIRVAFCNGNTLWCETHKEADKRELPVGLHMAESSAVALRTDINSLAP